MKSHFARKHRDRQGWILIGSVFGLVAIFLGFKMSLGGKPRPDASNCLADPQRSTIIVIDRSEEIGLQTLDEVKARAQAYVRDSVAELERVTIFTVDDTSAYALRPLLSLCRPPLGNRLTANVRLLEKRYFSRFKHPLDSALALAPGRGIHSPIAQTITDISLSQFVSYQNTLLVFSDLLEHTPRFSLYRCESPDGVVSGYRRSRRGALERPTFRNTKIFLHVIPRHDYPQSVWQCRDRLWSWFFGDDSGPNAGLTMQYLPGGSTASVPK